MSLTAPESYPGRPRFGVKSALIVSSIAGGALTVALLAPQLGRYAAIVAQGSPPHLPDMAVFAALSPALQIHIVAGLAAIGVGAALMVGRKGRRFHRVAGWIWTSLVLALSLSSLFITGLNGDRWSFLHLFTGWVLVFLPLAVFAARRHRVTMHKAIMMVLFYGTLLVTAALTFLPGRLMWGLFFG